MESIFFEISLVIIAATIAGTIARFFRQPLLPAYILVGVLLGPPVFQLIGNGELLATLSRFGIAFLLFLVGIELDVRTLLRSGRTAIMVGIVQMIVAVGIGYLLVRVLGFQDIEALFLSIALAFSSTIIILKLVGERRELDSLYGQLVIGIMLTQDFIAITILILFDVFFDAQTGAALFENLGLAVMKGFFLIALAMLASRFVIAPLFRYFARSSELLFLGAISWCLIFVMLALRLHFSIEVGALIAGISLSFVPYTIEIAHRIKSLRDFFLPLFFATLGGQLLFAGFDHVVLPAVILSAFVLLISPIVVMGLLLWRGYDARTSFQTGVSIGQISEFSFILVSFGLLKGLYGAHLVGLVALIGLVTMTVSTYVIEYSHVVYGWLKPLLLAWERSGRHGGSVPPSTFQDHTIVIGYGIMGYEIVAQLAKQRKKFIIVDHNPDVIARLERDGIPAFYGSIADIEVLQRAGVASAAMVLSTVRWLQGTQALLEFRKKNHITTRMIVTAEHPTDALRFYRMGAAFVFLTKALSTDHLADIIEGKLSTQQRKRSIAALHLLARHQH